MTPILIGHRGALDLEPENTLRSFAKALEHSSVQMVEFDVHALSSGELVVIHDDTVNRTTNGRGSVADFAFADLRALDAGKGEKIPTLQEVLDLVLGKVEVNIELKGENTAKGVAEIITSYLKKGRDASKFLVSSFNQAELTKFKQLMPDIRIGVLLEETSAGSAEYAQKMGAYSIHPSVKSTNQALVDDAHKRGLKVYVWTLKSSGDIKRMKKLGVDGIFVNNPELAFKALENR